MSKLILTRKGGQCVRLEMFPGVFMTLIVAYVGGDQVKFELTDPIGGNLVTRVNVGEAFPVSYHDCGPTGPRTAALTIAVISINFRNVKLGFDAPLDIKIVRTELLERAQ